MAELFGICPACNVAGAHWPLCTAPASPASPGTDATNEEG